MPFTEFACRSGGSNLNAGTRTGNSTVPGTAASFTYDSGNWDGTSVFTVASGNPSTDGVAVGDFASVYANGSTVTGYVGRVTAVTSTTITVSTTARSGTAPTSGTANRTLRIGGAWLGPNGSSGFPMNFVTNTLTNAAGDLPRVDYCSDQTMSITANISTVNADVRHQGFTTSYGDFGKAILRGPTTGASFNLIGTSVGANAILADFDCGQNGATGSSGGVFWNSTGLVLRCVFHDFRGAGLQSNNSTTIVECEAYGNNQSNTASVGGFQTAAQSCFVRCIAHDNSGGNSNGFFSSGQMAQFMNCIADTNGARGFQIEQNANRLIFCDAYNNGSDGIRLNSAVTSANLNILIESCNLTKNGGWGVLCTGGNKFSGSIMSCGFGAGTEANTSGTTSGLIGIIETNSVTYSSNASPYNAPSTGDFRITLASAKGSGRGAFQQTQSGYTGTVGYPDIGAAQHADSGGSTVIVIED